MIVDTSAIIALLFNEPTAPLVSAELRRHAGSLSMCTINLTESLIVIRDRRPERAALMETQLTNGQIRFIPPDVEVATLAADARLRYPLNIGDCFAYALAKTLGEPLLTLDRDFRSTDIEVILPSA